MFIQIDQCFFSSAETDFITEQAIFLLDDRYFLLGLVFSVVGFLLVLWLKEYTHRTTELDHFRDRFFLLGNWFFSEWPIFLLLNGQSLVHDWVPYRTMELDNFSVEYFHPVTDFASKLLIFLGRSVSLIYISSLHLIFLWSYWFFY